MKISYAINSAIMKKLFITGLMTILVLFNNSLFAAPAAKTSSDFNHMQTGFTLSGAHTKIECETCHVGGLFKGTPTACDGCHAIGRRVIATPKPASHVVTNQPCDACHTNTVTFNGIRFNHIGVMPKTCMNCHNGINAPGKPGGHLLTTSQCDSCHRNSAWVPAGFDHLSATPTVVGRCAQCHNNVQALGKPANHVVTTAQCDTCHTNTNYVSFAGLKFDHAGVIPGQCGTCHTGQMSGAPVQTPTHIPYSGLGCDNCHATPPAATAFNAPLPAMNHGAVSALTCSKCHNGSYTTQAGTLGMGAQAKTPNHVSTATECNVCHYSFTSFANGVMNHSAVTPAVTGRCNDCHLTGAGGAKQKPAVHIPTNNQCDGCHSGFVTFQGSATMNHAIEAAQRCDICHNGSYTGEGSKLGGAKAKTSISNHIPTAITDPLDCNTCHASTTSFTTEKMNHNGALGGTGTQKDCKTCHNNGTNYAGNMTKMTLGSHQGSKTTDDCSKSSCHKPTGNVGSSWTKWN
jgi:hypothetical protein